MHIFTCKSVFFYFSEKRQTMLFSATPTKKTQDLARLSLKKFPMYVGVDDSKEVATVEGLVQVSCLLHLFLSFKVINLLLHRVVVTLDNPTYKAGSA
jgi:superfamily II DNA/RNA helicase